MPVYTYHCESCDHEFDERQSFSEDALKNCPKCEKKEVLYKIYKPAQIVFKGSGYYVTDNKSRKSTMKTPPKSEDGKGKKEDAKGNDKKSSESKTKETGKKTSEGTKKETKKKSE